MDSWLTKTGISPAVRSGIIVNPGEQEVVFALEKILQKILEKSSRRIVSSLVLEQEMQSRLSGTGRGAWSYESFARAMDKLVEQGLLAPVKASGYNGRIPLWRRAIAALPNRFTVLRSYSPVKSKRCKAGRAEAGQQKTGRGAVLSKREVSLCYRVLSRTLPNLSIHQNPFTGKYHWGGDRSAGCACRFTAWSMWLDRLAIF